MREVLFLLRINNLHQQFDSYKGNFAVGVSNLFNASFFLKKALFFVLFQSKIEAHAMVSFDEGSLRSLGIRLPWLRLPRLWLRLRLQLILISLKFGSIPIQRRHASAQ